MSFNERIQRMFEQGILSGEQAEKLGSGACARKLSMITVLRLMTGGSTVTVSLIKLPLTGTLSFVYIHGKSLIR